MWREPAGHAINLRLHTAPLGAVRVELTFGLVRGSRACGRFWGGGAARVRLRERACAVPSGIAPYEIHIWFATDDGVAIMSRSRERPRLCLSLPPCFRRCSAQMRHSEIPAPYRGTKVPGQEVYDGWREARHEFATAEGERVG
jgi:hypothetical protein